MLSDTIDPQCNTRALFRPIAAEIIMLLDTMSQCLTRYTYIFSSKTVTTVLVRQKKEVHMAFNTIITVLRISYSWGMT